MGSPGTETPPPALASPPSPGLLYLDSNSTTPLLPEAWEAMRPFLGELYGNPASAHQAGRRARKALEDCRETLAGLLDAHPDEVIFTSGATEANNLALFGLAGDPPGRLVTSPIEHPCVIEPLEQLAQRGFTLARLPIDASGIVSLAEPLPPDTRLVAVMLANHETGAIQPIRDLVNRAGPVAFHCDAAQAVGKMPVRFHELGVTSLSLSAHKFHGPKGVGALLLDRRAQLRPLLWGGHQQRGRRPGTEPVALVAGMTAALVAACRDMDQRRAHVARLRSIFLDIASQGAECVVNGPETGLPHTLNMSFPGLKADALLMALDLAGVACSTGSACSSGSLLPSPVLKAMGLPEDRLRSALRFSFSHLLALADVEEAARRVVRVVRRLREADEANPESN